MDLQCGLTSIDEEWLRKGYSTIFFSASKSNFSVKLFSSLSDEGMETYRNAIAISCGFAGLVAPVLK